MYQRTIKGPESIEFSFAIFLGGSIGAIFFLRKLPTQNHRTITPRDNDQIPFLNEGIAGV